jgi:formate hydrogenlyase subunit 3/multisubunit Na+/H+ antiporter MnhD subunit
VTLLGAGLAVLLLAGILALALENRPRLADQVFRWGMVAGCMMGLAAALRALTTNGPAGTAAAFGLDPLSAWFTIVTLGPGAAAAGYGAGYLAPSRPARRVGIAHLLLAVLLTGLTGVVTARTPVTFLVSFEVMAVSAYFLVVFEQEKEQARRAGLLYLVLTHVSIIALLGMFAAWRGASPGATFADLAATATAGQAPVALVLLLALTGFGIKAGMVPAHFWLPGAHAAAPSHVSALLSGVVLKSGVYGLLRVLALIGSPPGWWAWMVLLLGLASAVLGVVWALAQHDIKRLLAYHSVENIGIILMGLGLGALGLAYDRPVIALFGITGAVLHSLNHALFKSLLFLGAGVVAKVAGTREIDRLGGLLRVIPRTAWAFVLASMAIVGLPPLNGFVSEWVIFRGLLEAGSAGGALRVASAMVAGLALTGALALACFTKLFGVVFLGNTRNPDLAAPGAERGLVAPQVALALGCIGIGAFPFVVIPAALRAASVVLGTTEPPAGAALVATGATTISLVAAALLLLVAGAWGLRALGRPAASVRETWACGYVPATSRMQYTAAGYASSLLGAFGALSGSRVVAGPGSLEVHAGDPILDHIGRRLWGWIRRWADSLRRLQMGRMLWYLLYVISALVGLLLYLWLADTG